MTAPTRLAVTTAVFASMLLGWGIREWPGAATGLVLGLITVVVPWRGQPLWGWARHWLNRNRPLRLPDPVAAVNDRSGGGVRFHDGVAVAVVQLLGMPHRPTMCNGSTDTHTSNTFDVAALVPMLRQSMGLIVESASLITAGARRRSVGDYPRVYDTFLGTVPYAGRREAWLVIRIRAADNGAALRWRNTVGTAALAAAQRIAGAVRCAGVRARVATAAEIVELERRLGVSALEVHNRRWHTLRGEGGWMTTYAYRPDELNAAALAQAWSFPADGIVQNITVFPDGTACAAVTIQTAQPPMAPPSVLLRTLPGEQAPALANNLCGPHADLRGQTRATLPDTLPVPIGPSGVLLGKLSDGTRLLMPLGDPGESSRVLVAADEAIAKRIIIRAAGSGERVTVHSKDIDRWSSVRMPNVSVTDQPRPGPGTTLSVSDGTVSPAPRPATVLDVGDPGAVARGHADVVIVQTGPGAVQARASGQAYDVEVEFFRAENRYLSPDLEMVARS